MITYSVTATLQDESGAALALATVSVRLSKGDIDSSDGFIAASTQTFTADVNGLVTMPLWPNARGSEGSVYYVQAFTAAGLALFSGSISVPEASSDLFTLITLDSDAPLQPYPAKDTGRLARLKTSLADYIKAGSTPATLARIELWITDVLNDAKRGRRWWFLENIASDTLPVAADVIDLQGDVERLIAVYAPTRLSKVSLGQLVELRQQAINQGYPQGGTPKVYALEAGKRLHLFPAPKEEISFAIYYTRPMAIEIVPDEWETILFDGVIGLRSRHFDRDALTSTPEEFLGRYKYALREARSDSFDMDEVLMPFELPTGDTVVSPISQSKGSISRVAPASLTGIGYDSLYIMQVG